MGLICEAHFPGAWRRAYNFISLGCRTYLSTSAAQTAAIEEKQNIAASTSGDTLWVINVMIACTVSDPWIAM